MSGTPSPVKTTHNKAYPSVSPTRPELAISKDKVVVITGAGGTIGTSITTAFAQAGAVKIALVGRRLEPLQKTKESVEGLVSGKVNFLTVQGDLASAESIAAALKTVASELGKIDILIANAGYLSAPEPIATANPEDWWAGFEINTKGPFNLARAFLPHAAEHAVVVDVSSNVVHMPSIPMVSSYIASKLAGSKVWESVAAENPGVEVVHVHPGTVESDMTAKFGAKGSNSAELSGRFMLWTVSDEAKKYRGKFLWVNWDVDELKARQEELTAPNALTLTLNGWPFIQ